MAAGAASLLAVSWPNQLPGDSFDHVATMVERGRAVAVTVRSIVESWPDDRAPIGLICLPVLALSGSGAGRRLLGLAPSRPLVASELAVNLSAPDDRLRPIFDVCSELGVHVATSAIEFHPAMPDVLFHTGFIVGPAGLALRSPKLWARSGPSITLISTLEDRYVAHFGGDAVLPVVRTPFGTLGMLVETEIDEDRSVETLAQRLPTIICNPTLRTGEHSSSNEDLRLAHVARTTHAVVISACASAEIVDDNDGGWVRHDFAPGTSIWSAEGVALSSATSDDAAVAWTSVPLSAA